MADNASKTRAKPDPRMPEKWKPRFLDEMDSRLTLVRKVRQRTDRIAEETGADTTLKKMLVDRLGFMITMIETIESEALLNGRLDGEDAGRWIQAVNCTQGLARTLGIERKSTGSSLQSYLASKRSVRAG